MTLSDLLKEFDKRLVNPKNTGYRVADEYVGAVKVFLEQAIHQALEECELGAKECALGGDEEEIEAAGRYILGYNRATADYEKKVKAFLEI